jgi:hypothetical protein
MARILPPTSKQAEPWPTTSWPTNYATEAITPIAIVVAKSSDAFSVTRALPAAVEL